MIAIEKDNNEEMFPIVDEQGNITGAATRGECHNGSKLLHPVVHLHVFNAKGDLFLQKRPLWKDIQPGRWDTAVGGHVDLGECVADALRREVREELGIVIDGIRTKDDDQPVPEGLWAEPLEPYVFESERERELVYPHRLVYEGEVHPSAETDGGRFWPKAELMAALDGDELTPNFVNEYKRLHLDE